MAQSAGNTNDGPISSTKPFPDESNREDIERMLLHAFEFAMQSGFLKADQAIAEVAEGKGQEEE